MNTEQPVERQLRSALRETLDRELGPDPVWGQSPAARRVAELDSRSRRRWPLRVLAVAALIGAGGGAALLGGRLDPAPEVSQEIANGWVAFTLGQPDSAGLDGDLDIWLVALDRDAQRIVGTDTDDVDQLCPAFSSDGRSFAYGRSEGHGTEVSADAANRPAAYRNAALVVADVDDDGRATDRLTVDVGDGLPPPCPVWSPSGEHIAFGAPRTSPVNPETSANGSEVWVVTLADGSIEVLPDLLATDLDWSPDGSHLAIASGAVERVAGEGLQDGRIHLYTVVSGDMPSLAGTLGAEHLTWSPDGRRIAYTAGDELRSLNVATGREDVLVAGFDAIHGIGPVFSPDGETIVYQRVCDKNPEYPSSPCREQHEVVMVTPPDRFDVTALATEVVLPMSKEATDGSSGYLFPSRVTWSPDGQYLLYQAWPGKAGGPWGLVAVPTNPDLPSVVLAQFEHMQSYEGYPDTSLVPIQTWGRRP